MNKPNINLLGWLWIVLSVVLSGCGGAQPFREVFRKQTPHQKYEQSLKNAHLDETALGKEWIRASEKALRDSLVVSVPFRETGYFAADKPTAMSYQLNAQRGERLVVEVETKALEPVQLFIDIFEIDDKPQSVASADTNTYRIEYEVRKNKTHLVRVQPELLRSGNYTLTITTQPSLAFPVQGKTSQNIASFWGASRDGGRRKHEGIDIFATRGTPVLAATEGIIRGVNENRLGGKVVWLWDSKRNQSLYYAHLDSQLVRTGQRVSVGDTLGLVGNTGNAKTTNPHLHFGIYTLGEGAIDPFPSVRRASDEPKSITANLQKLNQLARAAAKKVKVHIGPDATDEVISELPKHTPVWITGATAGWYRVQLPDGLSGYISAKNVESLEKPLRKDKLKDSLALLDYPNVAAPTIDTLAIGASLSVLANTESFSYVETNSGKRGWITK